MATAWGGADPQEVGDPDDYELGCEYLLNSDLTISDLRIWTGVNEVNVTNRRGRIWSTGGVELAVVTLPANLTPGWTVHPLDTPLERISGSRIVVSYSTGGNYGAATDALATSNVPSSDGTVIALSTANATNGNGVFNGQPGSFPATSPASHSFYGTDFVYSLGVGGATAPTITAATAVAAGAVVTATTVATDAETLVGATYRWDWGDGTAVTSSAAGTTIHTYAASGTYGILASVTDAGGLVARRAVGVDVAVPSAGLTPLDAVGVIAAVQSHALASGRFDAVNGHEPRSAPGAGLTAAIWVQAIEPVPAGSGLAQTTIRVALGVRIYTSALAQPPDAIDPAVIAATDALMAAYSGDFQLGGQVRNVDLLGQHGVPLRADAGYLQQDGKLMRVMTITLPLICNDVWEQHE